MERLKSIIEIFAQNDGHRQCLKEIEDIPLSVFLSQNLYKLNGDIRRLSESKINDINNKFSKSPFEWSSASPTMYLIFLGQVLTETDALDEAYESIAKLLDAMQEEWEEVSEKFRYQDQSDLMYEIVDNFLQNRLSQDKYLEDQS